MNARHFHALRRPIAALVLVAQCAGPVAAFAAADAAPKPAASKPAATKPAAPARATAAPARKLPVVVTRALGLYQQDRFDEAVTLLTGPVSRGELQGADLREARIVLARCYVKKGLTNRANEHFNAILAAEPAFVLDAGKADAEEIAAFQALKPAPVAAATPAAPPATAGTPAPREKTPGMKAALPPQQSSGAAKKGWLASHKAVAVLLAVAGGGAVAALAGGGGDSGPSIPPTPTVPDFPPPPTP